MIAEVKSTCAPLDPLAQHRVGGVGASRLPCPRCRRGRPGAGTLNGFGDGRNANSCPSSPSLILKMTGLHSEPNLRELRDGRLASSWPTASPVLAALRGDSPSRTAAHARLGVRSIRDIRAHQSRSVAIAASPDLELAANRTSSGKRASTAYLDHDTRTPADPHRLKDLEDQGFQLRAGASFGLESRVRTGNARPARDLYAFTSFNTRIRSCARPLNQRQRSGTSARR